MLVVVDHSEISNKIDENLQDQHTCDGCRTNLLDAVGVLESVMFVVVSVCMVDLETIIIQVRRRMPSFHLRCFTI